MTPEFVTGFFLEAIKITIILAAPMLLAGLVTGLLISIFQAATSINEMTMTFIPKMLAVAIALLVAFPRMLQVLIDFLRNLLISMPDMLR